MSGPPSGPATRARWIDFLVEAFGFGNSSATQPVGEVPAKARNSRSRWDWSANPPAFGDHHRLSKVTMKVRNGDGSPR